MPGAPHMRAGRPIGERSTAQIVWLFMVLPTLVGLAILCHLGWNVAMNGARFTTRDWFWGVGWYGLLGLGVMFALPAAGYQELRRRKRQAKGLNDPEQQAANATNRPARSRKKG